MCGIAGQLNSGHDHEDVVRRQLDLLMHRGPDAVGMHTGSGAVVGQTRLAIIDLVTGDPPIGNENGSVGVALNGEIYNYRALRASLEGHHRFKTQGDTEVIAHLAEDREPRELAAALDGMFAFAVWDETRRRLVLGRDRLGKKPLYYWEKDGELVFASEIKALLAHPKVSAQLDDEAIPAFLTFGYVPTPRTFFSGIRSVPPGHVLVAEPGRSPALVPYWDPQFPSTSGADPHDLSFEAAVDEVRRLLTDAVEKRLISDVPLGAFLSGGIDSSIVVGVMAQIMDQPVRTFTIGFDDPEGFDERPYARLIAERFGTDHTEFVVRPDAVELVETLVDVYDQPFGDSSAIPTYLLSQLTRQHVTVALSGDGGDELFAGYERFLAALLLERYRPALRAVAPASRIIARWVPARRPGHRAAGLHRLAGQARRDVFDAYAEWVTLTSTEQRRELTGSPSNWALDDYRDVWDRSAGSGLLERLLDLNLSTYLVDDLLVKLDRASMAHALEVRSPFLDTALVQFAVGLPSEHKIKGSRLKRVLKAAVEDLLPKDILRRRKKGFGVPVDRWFRDDLRTFVTDRLGSSSARLRAHVKPDGLDRILNEHVRGSADRGQLLWALLTLEVFLRKQGW